MPKVSVVMATFNNERFIRQAIDSVLSQTYGNFEFIIVNDASNDNTSAILNAYKDHRIKILTNLENLGVPCSAQIGLNQAQGEYIARMDGDDVSLPERFALQVDFLDKNPEVGVVGGQRKYLDSEGNIYDSRVRVHLSHNLIVWRVFLGASFWHPSTMIRKKVLDQVNGYNPIYYYASDLELWTRLMFVCKFANLDEILIHYRIHENNNSQRWKELPAVPPPRTKLAERLVGEAIPPDRFNLITSILYSDMRVENEVSQQLIEFLIRLFHGLVISEVFSADINDVIHELTSNITKISRQSPKRLIDVLRYALNIYYARLSKRVFFLNEDRKKPAAMRKFLTDRRTGNKPCL